MITRAIFNLTLVLALFSCNKPLEGWNKHVHDQDALNAQMAITKELLNKHISTLASDEFQGRFPGTIGEDKTLPSFSTCVEKSTFPY